MEHPEPKLTEHERASRYYEAQADLLSAADMLNEWLKFWADSNDMPAKMPDALHVRTALFLQEYGFDVISIVNPQGVDEVVDVQGSDFSES